MKNQLFIAFSMIFLCFATLVGAQHSVSGTVVSDSNEPLIGVSVVEKGTNNGTATNIDGQFNLTVASGDAVLVLSYTGYSTNEVEVNGQSTIKATLSEGVDLGTVQIVGTRSYKRSATETPVAVDIINIQEVANKNGNIELNRILQYSHCPSYNFFLHKISKNF